jgi:hypothetical protein
MKMILIAFALTVTMEIYAKIVNLKEKKVS